VVVPNGVVVIPAGTTTDDVLVVVVAARSEVSETVTKCPPAGFTMQAADIESHDLPSPSSRLSDHTTYAVAVAVAVISRDCPTQKQGQISNIRPDQH